MQIKNRRKHKNSIPKKARNKTKRNAGNQAEHISFEDEFNKLDVVHDGSLDIEEFKPWFDAMLGEENKRKRSKRRGRKRKAGFSKIRLIDRDIKRQAPLQRSNPRRGMRKGGVRVRSRMEKQDLANLAHIDDNGILQKIYEAKSIFLLPCLSIDETDGQDQDQDTTVETNLEMSVEDATNMLKDFLSYDKNHDRRINLEEFRGIHVKLPLHSNFVLTAL